MRSSSTLLLCGLSFLLSSGHAFVSRPLLPRATHQTGATARYALKQLPGESNSAFFKRITQAASDPVLFEKMLKEQDEPSSGASSKSTHKSTTTTTTRWQSSSSSTNPDKQRRGYQRAEEWEADQEKIRAELSWEERVAFDGQRNGNRFQQNEILRKNLNLYH